MQEQRNWAELPSDVLFLIFQNLNGVLDLFWPVEAVCSSWRQVVLHHPQLWRCVDMSNWHNHWRNWEDMDFEKLVRKTVVRSGGHMEELRLSTFVSDDLLAYIADRTTGLRCLSMIGVSRNRLVDFVSKYPLLEDLQITLYYFSPEVYGDIGRACPELKRFRLAFGGFFRWLKSDDQTALQIASSMPQLRELHLISDPMTNEGLHAILDNCLHLQFLEIGECNNVRIDTGLEEKMSKIKNVRLR